MGLPLVERGLLLETGLLPVERGPTTGEDLLQEQSVLLVKRGSTTSDDLTTPIKRGPTIRDRPTTRKGPAIRRQGTCYEGRV